MGKASSAKKVARVARAGNKKSSTKRRQWGFPSALGALIVAGVLLIVFLRGSQPKSAADTFPRMQTSSHPWDHIHEAYGLDVCGKFLPAIPETAEGEGLHTHGDGVVHIHPISSQAAGKNAKLKVWLANTGLQLSESRLVVPRTSAYKGATFNAGGTCQGKPAVLRVAEWHTAIDSKGKATTKAPDKIYTKDFGDIWLGHDGGALTIYYGPETDKIPLPPSSALRYLYEARGGNDQTVAPSSTIAPTSTSPSSSSTTSTTPKKK